MDEKKRQEQQAAETPVQAAGTERNMASVLDAVKAAQAGGSGFDGILSAVKQAMGNGSPAAQTGTEATEPTKPFEAPTLPQASYTSPYDEELKALYKSITEHKPFEYDADDDAMYQQYKDRYMQLGSEAMRDTMGQAAALTGGYGSTYSQGAGQQAYDRYMLGLNDKANELYEAAYGRWQDEDAMARKNYSMLGDLADRDYNAWADEYSRMLQRYGLAADEAALRAGYGDMSGIEALYGDKAAAGAKWQYAYTNPDLAYNTGAITAEEYYNISGQYPKGYLGSAAVGVSVGGGGGWSGVDYDNHGLSMNEVKDMQEKINEAAGHKVLEVDGLWGDKTDAAIQDYLKK